jgi:hypothetical protein
VKPAIPGRAAAGSRPRPDALAAAPRKRATPSGAENSSLVVARRHSYGATVPVWVQPIAVALDRMHPEGPARRFGGPGGNAGLDKT